ncbi:hypothetical protein P3342_010123 [Pyrenophora teres f. teres]|nr:hypothetical protein P3342_010123 [Pyrenophora teres f. teres]
MLARDGICVLRREADFGVIRMTRPEHTCTIHDYKPPLFAHLLSNTAHCYLHLCTTANRQDLSSSSWSIAQTSTTLGLARTPPHRGAREGFAGVAELQRQGHWPL